MMDERYEIEVGNFRRITTRAGGVFKEELWMNLWYCGMPNEQCFSVGLEASKSAFGGYGFNLYYPLSKKEVRILGWDFRVADVNPDKIILEYLNR